LGRKIITGGNEMRMRSVAIFGILAIFVTCILFQGVAATSNTTAEDDWFVEKIGGIGGQLVSTIFWVVIGLVLILGAVGIVDMVTDKMKHNWLNLEELAGKPTAMAIIAAGLMIAIAIIIHGATI